MDLVTLRDILRAIDRTLAQWERLIRFQETRPGSLRRVRAIERRLDARLRGLEAQERAEYRARFLYANAATIVATSKPSPDGWWAGKEAR